MRILLLTPYFPPEMGALAARSSEHAASWAAQGHEVEICTAFPNYPSGVIPDEYRGKLYAREKSDGYEVVRGWVFARPKRSVATRLLNTLTFNISMFLCGLLSCRRPDVIIATSPPFCGPVGWVLSVLKRAKFVFEVRDILPQQAVDLGMLKNPLVIRVLTWVEEFLYRRARGIVTVAEASTEAIVARGFETARCHTVENGIREDFFAPGPRDNEVRDEQGLDDKFVVLYIGVHGVSQGLETILDTARILTQHEDIHFLFAGEGARRDALLDYVRQLDLKNVSFLPAQPKERMPLFYAAADACLVPLRRGDYFKLNIPSKVFEIMACARPIVIGAEGQALALVQEAGAGIPAVPEDPQSYADAILRLRDNPDEARALGESGRAYVIEHFTRRKKADRYIEVLEEIVRGE
ncbi:MAG: glycosyltransferase family 4 protein [bacterium]|nr:glycosyltransferase family 4 protein [bacterium]